MASTLVINMLRQRTMIALRGVNMKRRSFIKSVMAAATAVIIPFQLTEFGGALNPVFGAVHNLKPFTKMPLATIDADPKWVQVMYSGNRKVWAVPNYNVMFMNVREKDNEACA